MSIDINPINDSESIRAYRHRILIFTQDIKEETDPKKRALVDPSTFVAANKSSC
jgi:hypothetical protein